MSRNEEAALVVVKTVLEEASKAGVDRITFTWEHPTGSATSPVLNYAVTATFNKSPKEGIESKELTL